jgi:hypothetical protein
MELCGTAHLYHTTHQPVYERFHLYSSSTEYVNGHHHNFPNCPTHNTAIQNPSSVTSCNHTFEEDEKEEVQVLPSNMYVSARGGPAFLVDHPFLLTIHPSPYTRFPHLAVAARLIVNARTTHPPTRGVPCLSPEISY